MTKNKGRSLLEVLIAIGLTIVITMGIFQLMTRAIKQQSRELKQGMSKLFVKTTLNLLHRELFNSSLISPSEKLNSSTGDFYRGLSGINGASIPVLGCQFETDAEGERYSILRYTKIVDRFKPNTVMRFFKEDDVGTIDNNLKLRLSYFPDTESENYVIKGVKPQTKEILLIDADTTDRRRYVIDSVSLDSSGFPLAFDNLIVELQMPKRVGGASVEKIANLSFVTDSIAYGLSTNYLCVNPKGQLVIQNEISEEQRVLLDVANQLKKIERFEITYLGTVDTQRIDFASFIPYPYEVINFDAQKCFNTVQISVILSELNDPSKVMKLRKLILINNFNSNRPAGCGTP